VPADASSATPDLLRCALPSPHPERVAGIRKPFRWHTILEGLTAARRDPAYAGPTLSRWFRSQRRIGSRDRKVIQGAIYSIIRHELLFLRAGARSDADHLELLCQVLEGSRLDTVASTSPVEDYATALSLGYRIAAEWLEELGAEEAAEWGRVQAERAPVTVRANRLRCTRAQLRERLAHEGVETTENSLCEDALDLNKRINLPGLAAFKEGWLEVQDASSQAFVAALPLEPDQTVFDFCAGAGGKSLALAARGARVYADDVRTKALRELARRAERAGAPVLISTPDDRVDLVVVDAPCSGTGRLRREPTLRWGLEQDRLLPLQASIVEDAATWVRPGGHLAYATCSLLRRENTPALPEEMAGWELVDAQVLWPHRTGADGFGWRVWRRPT
jgi:16S rRNA (cytosine967-C5)-methyltransferase